LRDLRELLRHRAVLTGMRSAVKKPRARAAGPPGHPAPEHSDLFGKAGREFLASVELPEGSRRRLERLMSLIGDFDREITATTREIDARAKTAERVKVLCTIRGVGRYTAMLIIAEVGDVKRFPTARHLCAWAGLTPSVRSSDGKARLGHLSPQGSPALRWARTEAAQKIPTGAGPLRATFDRIAKRRGRNVARFAVAHQILTLCYYALRDGEIRCLKHEPIENHDEELAQAA
jgi:transposase